MIEYAVKNFVREIESFSVFLDDLNYPHRLFIVPETFLGNTIKRFLADVSEGRMSEVVS